ncbi:MAG: hypothetical protein UX29_C0016G0001, partial [Parcubacteria group bacterium GW2011_GWA2_46_10]
GLSSLALTGLIGSLWHSGVIISVKLIFVNVSLHPQLIHIRRIGVLFDE